MEEPLNGIDVNVNGAGALAHAGQHRAVQLLVGQLLEHRLKQCRLDHVEGSLVVIEHGHGFTFGIAQHCSRILLELGHADGVVGKKRLHKPPKLRANYSAEFLDALSMSSRMSEKPPYYTNNSGLII
jgi:hypothetical protein